ncbi:hypothetical protein PoB_000872400 [Plakobranchus ocellatus]|uniref:Uncharacterized protein n=1 Tax=Plakobranchus ocellatus TaxID=259542 RepID=A0AAV3YIW3_9GAST|nr:hypothetical protein PoB_000872400 [Plakobranchus ocellatus]
MDGHAPFYPASMYTKDFEAGVSDSDIGAHAHHGFMASQASACYYACSATAQEASQNLSQGYFGGQAMTVVDQEDQEEPNGFFGSTIEQHLLHPAFSQHLQHLQQQHHQHQQNQQHYHHHHHHHHLLHYGVDEVAAHLAHTQAERLYQVGDGQQQQHHVQHQHQEVPNSFTMNDHLNNQTRNQLSYHAQQSHHNMADQATNLQQALLMDTVLSNLSNESSPTGDSLLAVNNDPNAVHNTRTAANLSPMVSNQDQCKTTSPTMDLENTCKQQQQQKEQPLPFPWMKTTKSHAHQWKAQWPVSPQEGDLKLSGPPSGQGRGGGAQTHNRRVPAYLRADSV